MFRVRPRATQTFVRVKLPPTYPCEPLQIGLNTLRRTGRVQSTRLKIFKKRKSINHRCRCDRPPAGPVHPLDLPPPSSPASFQYCREMANMPQVAPSQSRFASQPVAAWHKQDRQPSSTACSAGGIAAARTAARMTPLVSMAALRGCCWHCSWSSRCRPVQRLCAAVFGQESGAPGRTASSVLRMYTPHPLHRFMERLGLFHAANCASDGI